MRGPRFQQERDASPPMREAQRGPMAFTPGAYCQTFTGIGLLGVTSGSAVGRGGYYPEQPIGTLPVTHTNLAVHCVIPVAWFATATKPVLRIYTIAEGTTSPVFAVEIDKIGNLTLDDAGEFYRGVVTVRGLPADGWKVTVATNGAALAGEGTFTLLSWGQNAPADYHTLLDGVPNPVQGATRVESYGMVYSDELAQWFWMRGDPEGQALVTITARNEQLAVVQNAGSFLDCNNRGDLFVVPGIPDPAAPVQTQIPSTSNPAVANRANVKATLGFVHKITASNIHVAAQYFCIVDKASAPGGGDAIKWSWLVVAGGRVDDTFALPLQCSAGVSYAWSSTSDVVTLGTAAPCDIQYN